MKYALLLIGVLFSFNVFAADPALGVWQSAKNDDGIYIDVTITKCGNAVCGKQTATYGTKDTSKNGTQIIRKMKNIGSGNYGGGTIFAPDTEKTYVAKMKMISANKMKVSGCLSKMKIACRSQVWTKK